MNITEEINIFFSYDSKNLYNYNEETKNLIKFIRSEIDKINKLGKYLQIKLVDENNKESILSLKNKNITNFPILFKNDLSVKIYGCTNIKNYLSNIGKTRNNGYSNNHNEDIIHKYQMAQLGKKNKSGNLMNCNDEDDYDSELISHKENLNKATFETQRRMNINNINNNTKRQEESFSNENNLNSNRERNVKISNNTDFSNNMLYNQPITSNKQRVSEIQKSMRSKGGDSRDNDLMVNFWENMEETKI